MNIMKELLIDNNYINMYLRSIYLKFLQGFLYKCTYLSVHLCLSYYYMFFYCIKYSNFLKMIILSDLLAINMIENFYEFEIIYIILSYKINLRILSRIYCKKEDLLVSLSNLYLNANWLEREIWDLFGIKFIYHKDLRRILTDYGFVGHPLLKLYPLMGFTELRYDDVLNKVIREVIELSQAYRLYIYINPWVMWNN